MPGIERLPLWLRLTLYWVFFVVAVTAIGSLVTGEAFSLAAVITVGVISLAVVALFGVGERLRR